MDKVRLRDSSSRDMARDLNDQYHFQRTVDCDHSPRMGKKGIVYELIEIQNASYLFF